jgi:hypothetical protein
MRGIAAFIIPAGFLIAVSIPITFRYSIVPIGAGRLGAYRLSFISASSSPALASALTRILVACSISSRSFAYP